MLRGLTQDSTTIDGSSTAELSGDAETPNGDTSGAGEAATTTTGGTEDSTAVGAAEPEVGADATADATGMEDDAAMEGAEATADGEAMADGDSASEEAAAPSLRSPAEVRVLVLNGAAQRQGVAASGTETLKAASYNTAAPKNATKTTAQSLILYLDGYQAEAQAVADTFGPDLTGIVQPYDPASPPVDDIQGANVIVIVGEDDIIPIS